MALDSFRRDFNLLDKTGAERDTLQGNIVSTFQAGCFFGALLTFPVAEMIGRKKAIFMSAAIFVVGGSLMTASHGKLALLILGRAIAGLGIGSTSLCVPVYIAETSPPSIRGRLIGLFEIASQGGGMLGFWVCSTPITYVEDHQQQGTNERLRSTMHAIRPSPPPAPRSGCFLWACSSSRALFSSSACSSVRSPPAGWLVKTAGRMPEPSYPTFAVCLVIMSMYGRSSRRSSSRWRNARRTA